MCLTCDSRRGLACWTPAHHQRRSSASWTASGGAWEAAGVAGDAGVVVAVDVVDVVDVVDDAVQEQELASCCKCYQLHQNPSDGETTERETCPD